MGELGSAYVSIYPKIEGESLGSSLKDSLGGLGDVGGDLGAKLSEGIGGKLKAIPWATYAMAGAAAFAAAFKVGLDSYNAVNEGMNNLLIATGATRACTRTCRARFPAPSAISARLWAS